MKKKARLRALSLLLTLSMLLSLLPLPAFAEDDVLTEDPSVPAAEDTVPAEEEALPEDSSEPAQGGKATPVDTSTSFAAEQTTVTLNITFTGGGGTVTAESCVIDMTTGEPSSVATKSISGSENTTAVLTLPAVDFGFGGNNAYIKLAAIPADGYTFVDFTSKDISSGILYVELGKSSNVTATFQPTDAPLETLNIHIHYDASLGDVNYNNSTV